MIVNMFAALVNTWKVCEMYNIYIYGGGTPHGTLPALPWFYKLFQDYHNLTSLSSFLFFFIYLTSLAN